MGYILGPVKKHVEQAAYAIGPRFAIKTVYGVAAGQFDHPKGLALDFMINTPGLGKATGNALNAFVLANAGALNITYTIWYKQYYGKENNFSPTPYTGDSDHTDHVHVSFSATPGSGVTTGTTSEISPTGDVSFFERITDSGTWMRLAIFLAGFLFLGWGIKAVVKNG